MDHQHVKDPIKHDEEMDDFDVNFDDTFIGREAEIEDLKAHWKTHKIFGLFGLRSIGKSRLVLEFLGGFKKNTFELLRVDVGLINDANKLYTNLCALLKQEPDLEDLQSGNWMNHIASSINAVNGKRFVIFFDNTEDCQDLRGPEARDAFLSLLTCLTRQCHYIKIFITSTTRIQLAQLRKVYFSLELKALPSVQARKLLRHAAEGIYLGECEDNIIKLSEGLPLLLLMIGSELTENGGMITPKDMVELLVKGRLNALSREYYPPEDRVGKVYFKSCRK